jgi:glutathione S-transferase
MDTSIVKCWYGAPLPAPNPQRVRVFLQEKGLKIPEVTVNLLKLEHKKLKDKNPLQQVPVLELEDGTTLSETISICRYIEEQFPAAEPKLFGVTALQKGLIDQWIRRVEFILMVPLGMFWVNAHPYTKHLDRKRFADFGENSKETVIKNMIWFDKHMPSDFLAGNDFSMADIALLSTIDFANFVGVQVPEECNRLSAWKARVDSRYANL